MPHANAMALLTSCDVICPQDAKPQCCSQASLALQFGCVLVRTMPLTSTDRQSAQLHVTKKTFAKRARQTPRSLQCLHVRLQCSGSARIGCRRRGSCWRMCRALPGTHHRRPPPQTPPGSLHPGPVSPQISCPGSSAQPHQPALGSCVSMHPLSGQHDRLYTAHKRRCGNRHRAAFL